MNNLYHKVAVTCIYTALSFILVINKEAKAATLSAQKTEEFFVECYSQGSCMLTGPKPGPSGHSFSVSRNLYRYNVRSAFFEFSISNLSFIKSAIFYIRGEDLEPGDSIFVEIFGSTGNKKANPLDFGSIESLGNLFFTHPNTAMLDVTQFVSEGVSKRDAFVTLGIAIPTSRSIASTLLSRTYYGPRLIIETADVAEPVPEPTTIFGSALALGVGGWLKRKKSSQQNKTTSQN